MRSLLFILFTITLASETIAQNVVFTSPETDWQIMKLVSNNAPSMEFYHARSLKNSVLTFPKGYVLPVQFERKSFGLVFVDNKGNTKWRVETQGYVLGLAKLGENIICIYSPEWNSFRPMKMAKTMYAGLFNSTNGKLIKEQVVATNDEGPSIDTKLLTSPDQQFTQLLIRYAEVSRNMFSASAIMDKFSQTRKLKLITFSPTFVMNQADLNSAILKTIYEGCTGISTDEFVISSRSGNTLVTEKFNMNALSQPEIYTTTLSVNKKWTLLNMPVYSATQPGVIYQALNYFNEDMKNVIAISKTDFTNKKTLVTELAMDDNMRKELESDPDSKTIKKVNMDKMDLMDVVILKDKVLLLTQVRYTDERRYNSSTGPSNSYVYHNDHIMVNSFDNELKKIKTKWVARNFLAFLESGEKAAYYTDGNQLHLIYNKNDGAAKLVAEYAILDLSNNSITYRSELPKNGLAGDANIETEAVIWENGKAILPYNNSGRDRNGNTVFQVIELKNK